MRPVGIVRPATAADMKAIEAWLPTDYSVGTLAMNWKITTKVFNEGGVSVWVDAASDKPAAYCWGSLSSHSSVLEVQPEYRGFGVGRAMVEFMIENSIAERDPLLEIHIAPDSAEPFWEAMGFKTYWQDGKCYGRRMLELQQPGVAGIRRSVTVLFLHESALYSERENQKALACHELEGTEVADGRIVLDAVASHFDLPNGYDLGIDVLVDGCSRYRGKAKHSGARAIGVTGCRAGFMIGEIIDDSL